MATVYIQAHYLVDAIAGVLTAYPVYRLSRWIFRKVEGRYAPRIPSVKPE